MDRQPMLPDWHAEPPGAYSPDRETVQRWLGVRATGSVEDDLSLAMPER